MTIMQKPMEVTVSIIHTYDEACGRVLTAPARFSTESVMSWSRELAGRAACLFDAVRHRWTMRRIARFSAHRLQYIGFERDWDGSLIMTSGGAAASCSRR